MIVFDFIYYALVLWSGVAVYRGTLGHEGKGTNMATVLSAILIFGSLKGLIELFLGYELY